ncbi:MAG: hypothetical protein AMXMBFR57_01470 [Acidimicrobiia bacterium]
MKTIVTVARVKGMSPERFVVIEFDPAAARIVRTSEALTEDDVRRHLQEWTTVDVDALLVRARTTSV